MEQKNEVGRYHGRSTRPGLGLVSRGCLSFLLIGMAVLWDMDAIAQVRAARDGVGTRVNREGNAERDRFLIDGGTRSGDRQNLFHSFEDFGLSADQVATFLADPDVRNILSRVVGGDPSIINGLIEVTGGNANLYLLNPAGVVFGPNSRLNVPGDFTATTATGIGFDDGWFNAVGESDYAALVGEPGRFAFATTAPGSIINEGTLRVSHGSSLTLLGGTVINTGTLAAPGGDITIAAIPGDRLVRISREGMLLSLDIAALDDAATSLSDGMNPLPFTPTTLPELLTGDDISSATTIILNSDGTVTLAGSGLSIPVEPGTAIASGVLDASRGDVPADTVSALSLMRVPQVNVLGDRVALINATVDVSSNMTPGLIQIGGGFQGQGRVPNAQSTYVDSNTLLQANGVLNEAATGQVVDGGHIIAWANGETQFYGTASARGGFGGGNGGLIEISGKANLAFDGTVDVGANHGFAGTILFDPNEIVIVDMTAGDDNQLSPNVPNPGDPAGVVLFDDQPGNTFFMSADAVSALSGTVRLQAHSNIIVESAIVSTTIDTLILQAGNSIILEDPINLTNGSVVARINDEGADPAFRVEGEAQFSIENIETMGAILTTNGDITIEVGSFGGTQTGTVALSNTTIQAQNGDVSITGFGGVFGGSENLGVMLRNTQVQALDSGSITIRGTAGGAAGDISNVGVLIDAESAIEASGTADIRIDGVAGTAMLSNTGVSVAGSIAAAGGDITIVGTSDNGGMGGFDNYGVLLAGATLKNTGMGAIAIDGTVGSGLSGTTNNSGIALIEGGGIDGRSATASVIQVDGGTLSLDGQTSVNEQGNYGVFVSDGSLLDATGSGTIRVTGEAPADAGLVLDNGFIDAGDVATSQVRLTADEIDIVNGAQVEGAGRLTIQPLTPSVDIQLGGEGGLVEPDGQLTLSDGDIEALANGFETVTIGRMNSRGQLTVDGEVMLDDPTVLRSPASSGSIDTTGGTLRLADDASLTLLANRDIVTGDVIAPGRSVSVRSTNGAIATTAGVLDTSDINGGGQIQLTAADDITVGDVTTSAISSDGDGNTVRDAGNAGSLSLVSSNGTVRVRGSVTATSEASGNAGSGGLMRIDAAESIVVAEPGALSTVARAQQGNAGNGGAMQLSAGNTIRVAPRLEAFSVSESDGNAGRGGDIRLRAGRNIVLNNGADSSTTAPLGSGGRGDMRLTAERDIDVSGSLTTASISESGTADRGGRLRIRAGRDISIEGLDTSGEPGVSGGAISIRSTNGQVDVNAAFSATGATTRSGGSVLIEGNRGVAITLTPNELEDNGVSTSSTLTTSGQRFVLRSGDGPVGIVGTEPVRIATQGGQLRLRGTEVTTRNIRLDSSVNTGEGGRISLIAEDGAIAVGNIDSSGQVGGNLRIESTVAITAGEINTSGALGDGGDVFLDPPGDIVVDFIDARGGPEGIGGTVDITTERFFRAIDTFGSSTQPVSIATIGGIRNGAITIRHGGGGDTPFEVGSADVNGTVGIITSGDVRIRPFRSFLRAYREGNVSLLTRESRLPDVDLTRRVVTAIDPPDAPANVPELPDSSPRGYLTPTTYSLETVETVATTEFSDYLGRSPSTPQVTITEAQSTLQTIERDAGIKPAILYAFFVPAPVGVDATVLDDLAIATHDPLGFNDSRVSRHTQEVRRANHEAEYLVAGLPSSRVFSSEVDGDGFQLDASLDSPVELDGAIAQAFLEREPEATDELELILLTADTVVRRRIGGATRERVQAMADQFRSHITTPRRSDDYLPAAQALYRWLVEPLEGDLQAANTDNIAFVMDAGLRSLPVAALHDGHQFMIENYSVGLMPTLSLTDTRYADVRDMTVLAMGAEQFSELPPLPAVRLELQAITENVWNGVALMNDDFTITNLQNQRDDRPYGIIHLATHGEFQSGAAENSYIQFGTERLLLSDLPTLGLNNPPVELLVLSACRTALGDRDAELGFAGLALQAGVKSALGSLWYISDTGTLAVMTEFYQALQETPTKTEALRQAQLSLLNGTAEWRDIWQDTSAQNSAGESVTISESDAQQLTHPYYWSAFTIIGSPW
ncbi:MAG: CHAT domain-containing protein [Cyanobacteria bacterium P01_A01_bin.37]